MPRDLDGNFARCSAGQTEATCLDRESEITVRLDSFTERLARAENLNQTSSSGGSCKAAYNSLSSRMCSLQYR